MLCNHIYLEVLRMLMRIEVIPFEITQLELSNYCILSQRGSFRGHKSATLTKMSYLSKSPDMWDKSKR